MKRQNMFHVKRILVLCYNIYMGNHEYSIQEDEEIGEFTKNNPDWAFENNCLVARFKLADFGTAIKVINEVAAKAEQLDHHPRMTNTYNMLEFSLCTHSQGDRVTQLDLELAKSISEIVNLMR